jgi:glycosyltransferase involved in cell wall biosynthesis
MVNEIAERAKRTHLVEDAVARGQSALGAGDKAEASRWLDRAHRLAPADDTIGLLLASCIIGQDNSHAAALFSDVLATHDVRDAWLGLATARFLAGDLPAAGAALAEVLSRHALRPETIDIADRLLSAIGAPGWCGLTGEGVVIVHPFRPGAIETRVDGKRIEGSTLPPGWPRYRRVTVTAGESHLIGSPISLRSIGRVEGIVETSDSGVRGWAWCPGDPDANPGLTAVAGENRYEIAATGPAEGIPGLAPLALPRSFAIGWVELPRGLVPIHLRGRDGRELEGSPVTRNRDDASGVTRGGRGHRPVSGPARTGKPSARGLSHIDGAETVILVTHDDGGGVERRVQASIASHKALGRNAIVLRPSGRRDGSSGVIVDVTGNPARRFELPAEQSALLRLLRRAKPIEAELHHLLNHDASVVDVIRALGVPYDVHTHDFAWFCPRIALVGRGDRYCGEPTPDVCEACVAEMGSYLHEDIRVVTLLDRSRGILSGARRIIAPSEDAANRMARHFPDLSRTVIPHEDDAAVVEPPPITPVSGTVRVCVAGAIGLHKGFHVLLACARDARERALELSFIVAGTTIDDQLLIDTGRAFVTGPYEPDEAVALIRAQNATLAFLPSIWPETWCLGLTELWRAGLRVAAFDMGAPAKRIARTGRGFLMPLGLSPAAINDALMNAAKGRSFLPIQGA